MAGEHPRLPRSDQLWHPSIRNSALPSMLCSLESPPPLNLLPWEVAQRMVSPALGFISGSGDDGKDLDV